MSQSTQTEEGEPLREFLSVDADVHCSHTEAAFGADAAERMEWPWDVLLDPDENARIRDGPSTGHYGQIEGRLRSRDERVTEPSDVQEPLVDGLGIDHPILNVVGRYDMYPEKEMVPDWNAAVNDAFVERFLDADDDYFGLMSIQTKVPHRAAEEIDRMGDEKQIVGVLAHAGGQWHGLGDPQYDPIWQAAQDNDLAVAFTGSFSGYMMQMPDIFRGMQNRSAVNALQFPWAMMWTVSSIIANGTPEKFPDLNFVCLDAGLGWVPYTMARLNREYSTWRSQVPLLDGMPEEYIRDRFYFGTQPLGEFDDPEHMNEIIDLVGTESVLFSSDYPYSDPEDLQAAQEAFSHLSEEDQRKVFGENAIEAFDLPI